MIVGHYQCICRPGDFQANLGTVVKGLELARERGIEILSFPESFLGGYFTREEDCRGNAWSVGSAQMRELLERTGHFPATFLVGFNELRGDELYNTVAVIEAGRIQGTYSKAFPVMHYFTPGRETPVFQRDGLRFGVVICADGGYPEPTRVLVMKGARVIFAPHYNYIGKERLIDHYVHVRHDHVARAVENSVFFVRGNNVEEGHQESLSYEGVGYGDSYILDPNGQIMAAANLHAECMIWAEIDLERQYWSGPNKAARSAAAFWGQVKELLEGEEEGQG